MGHSKGFFSVPVLARLGWAGKSRHRRDSGSFRLADVEHSGRATAGGADPGGRPGHLLGGVPARAQPRYRPQHPRRDDPASGRRRAGRDRGRVARQPLRHRLPRPRPDNPALPVGSSITTPEGMRLTTVAAGRTRRCASRTTRTPRSPAAPALSDATLLARGRYRVHWQSPADNGQIVLGYQVTARPSGAVTFVRSPGAYRTLRGAGVGRHAEPARPSRSRRSNQAGWSAASSPEAGQRPVERQGRSRSPAT